MKPLVRCSSYVREQDRGERRNYLPCGVHEETRRYGCNDRIGPRLTVSHTKPAVATTATLPIASLRLPAAYIRDRSIRVAVCGRPTGDPDPLPAVMMVRPVVVMMRAVVVMMRTVVVMVKVMMVRRWVMMVMVVVPRPMMVVMMSMLNLLDQTYAFKRSFYI